MADDKFDYDKLSESKKEALQIKWFQTKGRLPFKQWLSQQIAGGLTEKSLNRDAKQLRKYVESANLFIDDITEEELSELRGQYKRERHSFPYPMQFEHWLGRRLSSKEISLSTIRDKDKAKKQVVPKLPGTNEAKPATSPLIPEKQEKENQETPKLTEPTPYQLGKTKTPDTWSINVAPEISVNVETPTSESGKELKLGGEPKKPELSGSTALPIPSSSSKLPKDIKLGEHHPANVVNQVIEGGSFEIGGDYWESTLNEIEKKSAPQPEKPEIPKTNSKSETPPIKITEDITKPIHEPIGDDEREKIEKALGLGNPPEAKIDPPKSLSKFFTSPLSTEVLVENERLEEEAAKQALGRPSVTKIIDPEKASSNFASVMEGNVESFDSKSKLDRKQEQEDIRNQFNASVAKNTQLASPGIPIPLPPVPPPPPPIPTGSENTTQVHQWGTGSQTSMGKPSPTMGGAPNTQMASPGTPIPLPPVPPPPIPPYPPIPTATGGAGGNPTNPPFLQGLGQLLRTIFGDNQYKANANLEYMKKAHAKAEKDYLADPTKPENQWKMRQAEIALDKAEKQVEDSKGTPGHLKAAAEKAKRLGFGKLGEALDQYGDETAKFGDKGGGYMGGEKWGGKGMAAAATIVKGIGEGGKKALESDSIGGIGEGVGQATKAVGMGLGGLLGPTGAAIGGSVGTVISLLAKSTDVLTKWNAQLFNSNMKFAEFSGAMAGVQARQEVRQIHLDIERGNRRAPGADRQAESMHRLNETIAPIEDAWAGIKAELSILLTEYVAIPILTPLKDLSEYWRGKEEIDEKTPQSMFEGWIKETMTKESAEYDTTTGRPKRF